MEGGAKAGETPVRALLIIDVQNDFVDGSLAVPDAKAVIPVINKLRSKSFDFIYVCLDWHPYNHCSFRTNNPGSQLFQVLYLPTTGDAQRMWPDHCVQGSHGAALHDDLVLEPADIHTFAGCNPRRDSYSVFKDNGSKDFTDMVKSLKDNKVTEIYALGLATDYCVQYTVLDAKVYLSQTAEVFLIEDGCRGLSEEGVKRAKKSFEFEKVRIIKSDGPEIGRIRDRKINLHGGLQLLRTPTMHRAMIVDEVDLLYESVIFQGVIPRRLLKSVVRSGFINRGCSWSSKNLLHACCETGNVPALKLLLESARKHLAITAVTRKGENALVLAVQAKCQAKAASVVRILLEEASPADRENLILGRTDDQNLSALMLACRTATLDLVELLLGFDSSARHLTLASRFGVTAIMYASQKNTPEAAAIVEVLLRTQPPGPERISLVATTDHESWNALHFGAKSGCFAKIDWVRALGGPEYVRNLPINAVTSDGLGFTALQLAAFNGRTEVIRTIHEMSVPEDEEGLQPRQANANVNLMVCQVNNVVKATGDTELDLAIKRYHIECARLLLRLGCHAATCSGSMQELLHRLVLMGDVEACESVLNHADENKIIIDEGLVVLTQRIEAPETCTFSFANYTHPVKQYLYLCEYCEVWVCLVCKDRCHGENSCRVGLSKMDLEHFPERGWTDSKNDILFCECERETCCASPDIDAREKEARTFKPSPINTNAVYLDGAAIHLSRDLARNTHNVWARDKYEDGWAYSKTRDDSRKLHPLLLPFDQLSNEATKYNVDIAVEVIKVIRALGYEITQGPPDNDLGGVGSLNMQATRDQAAKASEVRDTMRARPFANGPRVSSIVEDKFAEIAWRPDGPGCQVIDTTQVHLPEELDELVECVAMNSHDVWALEKIRKGWRYAPARNIKVGLKLNKALVPFAALDLDEKLNLRTGAEETVKAIVACGWTIHKLPAAFAGGEGGNGRRRITAPSEGYNSSSNANSEACHNLIETRRELFNQYLFAAARLGQLKSIDILISKQQSVAVGANLNARDSFHHTALYTAVKRGHLLTVRRLLDLKVKVNTKDVNGLTPLALSAYLGNLTICQELVKSDADILSVDKMGYTALHHAAYRGNLDVCNYLVESLQQLHQTNHIVNLCAMSLAQAPVVRRRARRKRSLLRRAGELVNIGREGNARTRITPVRGSMLRPPNADKASAEGAGGDAGDDEGGEDYEDEDEDEDEDGDGDESDSGESGARVAARRESDFAAIDQETGLPRRPNVGNPAEVGSGKSHKETDRTKIHINISRYSPLSLAVHTNQIGIVELLIRSGANPMFSEGDHGEEDDKHYAPYIRALMHHITIGREVHALQEELSARASNDMFFLPVTFEKRSRDLLVRPGRVVRKIGRTAIGKAVTKPESPTPQPAARVRRRSALFTAIDNATQFARQYSSDQMFGTEHRTTRQLNQALEQAQEKYAYATRMIDILNNSTRVRKWRNKRALEQFVRETAVLIIMIGGFSVMVPLWYDYDLSSEQVWKEEMQAAVHESIAGVKSQYGFMQWVNNTFLPGLEVTVSGVRYLKHNNVFGGMLLEHSQDGELEQRLVIPPGPPLMTTRLLSHRFSSESVDFGDVQLRVNLFNPTHELYGILDVGIFKQGYAAPQVEHYMRTFRVHYKRFPPSREFQFALVAIGLLFVGVRFRNWMVKRMMRRYTQTQWFATLLLILILLMDLVLYEITLDVKFSPEPMGYLDLAFHHRLLEAERRTIGFFYFLSMIPLLNAARTIPLVGPVVVALLNTMTSATVLIYLLVVAAACGLLSLTFHVAFGAEVSAWSTPGMTFHSLFHTPFIETWDGLQQITNSFSGAFLSTFYILFATITVNLLIAVVTDVYPKERKASDSLWETLITEGIENSLMYSRLKRTWRAGLSTDKHEIDLSVHYWTPSQILLGKDGIKHWKPAPGAQSAAGQTHQDRVHALERQLKQLLDGSGSSVVGGVQGNLDTASALGGSIQGNLANNSANNYSPEQAYDQSGNSPMASPLNSPKQQGASVPEGFETRMQGLEDKLDRLLATICGAGVGEPSLSTASPTQVAVGGSSSATSFKVGGVSYAADSLEKETLPSGDLRAGIAANAAHKEQVAERRHIRELLERLVAAGPCPLSRIKASCKAHKPPLHWDTVKTVRREMGLVQCKDLVTIDGTQRVVRFWRYGTKEELDRVREGSTSPRSPASPE